MIKAGSIIIKVSKIAESKEEMREPILDVNQTNISPAQFAEILQRMGIESLVMNNMRVTTSGINRSEKVKFYMTIPVRDWK
jgi:hypothetical protein